MKENIEGQVDAIFTEWDKTTSPGCALAVIKDGEIIYSRGYGMANLDLGVTLRPDSVFDIGSTSKQFTAACILMLARRGQLSLDDDIRKYLPEIPDYGDTVTVRHLVHHTSGIRDYLGLMMLAGMPFENDYQEDEVVALIGRQKELNFKPGDEHLYSNSGYFLLAEIVQRASGKNLRDFAEDNIFRPLGMKNTHFHNDFRMIVKNRASAYSPKPGGGFEIDMGIFDVLGDGAVYTTVEDLFKWDQNFYHNILDGGGQDFIDQMQAVGSLNSGEALKYAFGLMIGEYRGLKTVSHGGSWYGYRAQLLRFPEERYSFICLSNLSSMSPDGLVKQVADVVLAERLSGEAASAQPKAEPRAFVSLSPAQLEALAGCYQSDGGELGMLEVRPTPTDLVVEAAGRAFTMAAVSLSHLVSVGGPLNLEITFELDPQGKPTAGTLNVASGVIVEKIVPIQVTAPTAEQLEEYCGDFYSEEVNATHHITRVDGGLQLKIMSLTTLKLKPAAPDQFDGGMLTCQFQRDAAGRVSGYVVQAGRVKNIGFEKKG